MEGQHRTRAILNINIYVLLSHIHAVSRGFAMELRFRGRRRPCLPRQNTKYKKWKPLAGVFSRTHAFLTVACLIVIQTYYAKSTVYDTVTAMVNIDTIVPGICMILTL